MQDEPQVDHLREEKRQRSDPSSPPWAAASTLQPQEEAQQEGAW